MNEQLQTIKLWEDITPPFHEEEDRNRKEYFIPEEGAGIQCLTNVTEPTVTIYPATGIQPRPAVVVCPGGSYSHLAWKHEGKDICAFLNTIGFTAFLLKYRCPGRKTAAHADAARAIRLIRANADKLGIDKNHVGIIGFSAGAHLAAVVSAPAEEVPYPLVDMVDRESCRPDFTAMIYPAYLADDALNLAPEFNITKDVPPTFLLQAENDGVRVENSLAWALALKRAGVNVELHIYEDGGHGYGLLRRGNPISDWPILAGAWFRRQAATHLNP